MNIMLLEATIPLYFQIFSDVMQPCVHTPDLLVLEHSFFFRFKLLLKC
jgi:hypothetical protein